MQKQLANIFFSTKLTAVLFIAFAAAMATGTFLDAGQETSPTPYTRNLIYNAWWFEAITGRLILFPSSLTHMVPTVEGEDVRVSLSFNTFPAGTVGEEMDLTGLKLEV